MGLANPALLFGLLAAAAPIVLHLVMRQQPVHLEFPALRFVQVRENANRRKMNLRHLLLLLLRIAALCLLAFALARPSIKASGVIGDQEAPVAAALVFDTSPRMDYKSENQTRLEAAQDTGRWLLKQLPAESLVAVLDSAQSQPVYQVDLGAAQARLNRLETTSAPKPLWEVLTAAVELLKKGEPQREEVPERKEIYVFTDLARRQWDPTAAAVLRQRLAELTGLGIYIIDVGAKEPRNLALGELRLSAQSITRNHPWSIATELASTGEAAERAVEVYLFEGDDQEKRAEEHVKVEADQSQGVEFALGPLDTGTHQGFVRLLGTDGLAVDDRRWFTIDVRPPWKVLIAAAPPARGRAFYLTAALAPPRLLQTGQARFDYEVVPLAELAQQQLEAYSAVCLLDPGSLPGEDWDQLYRYASSGGGVAIFLGSAGRPEAFKEPKPQRLLAGELSQRPALYPDGEMYLTIANEQHPMMAKFRPYQGTVPWESLPVYRYWQLHELAKGAATIAMYRNGQPAIVERVVGKGRVVTMTTPISGGPDASEDNRWNDLATGFENWPFLVLVDQMFAYLAGSTEGQLNYLAGETAVLRLPAEQQVTTYLLATPLGDTYRQSADPKERSIIVTATEKLGNYRVTAGGESGGLDRGFSVNLPASASDLQRIDDAQLKEVFGEVPFQLAHDREQIDRELSAGRVGRELFPLLIALVAIVMGVEHVLANRFYREHRIQPARREGS
ncbi:MAG TPA: BatA domain-containing protein [Pirellulales bacterium]|nr:BatA domain-containing protein [Pirellulales bacterium]